MTFRTLCPAGFSVALLLVCLATLSLDAATIDKANNTDNLNLGSSWIGSVPPRSSDIAQWSATVTAANTVNLGADTNWLGLKLSNPGGNVTINGGETLTVGANGIDLSTSTRDLILNCPVTLSADQSWNLAGGRSVTFTAGVNAGNDVVTRSGAGTNVFEGGSVAFKTLNVTGGAARLASGTLAISGGSGAYGYAVVASGGRLEQTGGTLTTSGYFTVGQSSSGGTPIADLSGGSLGASVELLIGYAANGILNLSGSAVANAGAKLRLGQSGSATVNLNGGTLITKAVGAGGTSASAVNLNGGLLKAASPASPWWPNLAGVTAWVKSGGAWIDDGGFDVTVQQPLLDGTGGGGLRKSGNGSLTLTATNTYTGPTVISNGTLVVNGRFDGPGAVTVKAGGTLTGTGAVAGPVTIENSGTLAVASGDFASGALTLNSSSVLSLALAASNTGLNAPLRVNGNLTLDGSLTVQNAGGLVAANQLTAIYYTGTLVNHGLGLDPRSEWNVVVDTSTPNLVKLQIVEKYPLIECTNGNVAVSTTSTNLDGVLHGFPALPIWYEVRDATNRLWDFGSTIARSPWSITVRHLRPGTNTVTFFAQNSAGIIESNSVQLTLTLGTNPSVHPRPHPAEIWWGGTCHENLYSGSSIIGTYSRMEQLTNSAGWDFVKRFQDGFMLHGYVWVNNVARMTNWVSVGQNLSVQLAPFNTRFWLENAWRPVTNNMNYGHSSASGQVTDVDDLMSVGLALSEITQDFNPMWNDFSAWHPDWLTNDIRILGTGNTNQASAAYPFASGQWRDYASDFHDYRPDIKFGWTWSPVYFHWKTGPALADYGVFSVTNGGTTYSFNWDFYDWMNDAVSIGNQAGVPFAFASDCPWGWFGAWGNPTAARNNRKKIRDYEAWLQGQGARHTLICNDATSSSLVATPDLWDTTFKNNSLANMRLHQQEGGRATRYLFESWYEGPFTVLPETKPGSYANLTLEAIKYLKGIADTNGTLEPLALTLVSVGPVTTVRLQNNGSVACLPALVALESGNAATVLQYTNAAGVNITAQILSAEGYAHTNLLQPGQSTTISIIAQGSPAPLSKTVTFEAFWNPQDPGGWVRDRLSVAVPTTIGATNTFTWTGATSGPWTTSASWSNNTAPVTGGSDNTTLRFLGSGGYIASNNLAGQFDLNVLEANSTAANSVIGNALRFKPGSPSLNGPQLNQNGAGPFTVANSLILDADLSLNASTSGSVTLAGAISGIGGVIKNGSHVVTLTGINSFTGSTRINSGVLQIGDGSNNGELPDGPVTNNAIVRFVVATNTAQTFNGTITGTGGLQKQGSGVLILSASNSFSGTVSIGAQNVNGGELRVMNDNALGTAVGATFIGGGSSDARLELAGGITVAEPLTLAQDNGPTVHLLNVTGSNTLAGNITLNGGGNTWTIQSDADLLTFTGNFTNTAGGFTRPLQVQGDGDGELAGTLADTSLSWLQVRKYGLGTWTISGTATLPQGIQLFQGKLLVNGFVSTGNGIGNTVVSGGMLGGTGILLGSVTVQSGGTLAPGANAVGTLTISNHLTFAAGSTNCFELSKAVGVNDSVHGLGTLTFGGTLIVTNLSGLLATNDTFKLFDATNYVGGFDSIILPPLDSGLVWSNRLALDGSIQVVAAPATPPLLFAKFTSSNTLQFNWTNNGAVFRLQAQTNPASVGLTTNWYPFPGGSNPPVTTTIDPAQGNVFYRLINP